MPVPHQSADEIRLFLFRSLAEKRSVAMKKKVVYPEAESLSLDALKLELKKVRRELALFKKELQDFKTVFPLLENIIETSVRITRKRKIG